METWLVVEVGNSERNGYLTWKNQIDNLLSLFFTLTQSMIHSNKDRLTEIILFSDG
jgi:hypothetical protein